MRVMGGSSEACRRERGPVRRQLGVIFFGSDPWIIFVTSEMMTLESPLIIRGCKLRFRASWRPLMRPQSLTELFISCPRKPALMCLIFPVLSLITAPKHVSPGLPLEAPSKFTSKNLGGGSSKRWSIELEGWGDQREGEGFWGDYLPGNEYVGF
jgi:hypothetical protein